MTVKVVVAEGRAPRDALGRELPKGTFAVNEKDLFWSRLLRDRDLVPAPDDAASPVAAPAAATEVKK
ncbi:hypothetical protein JUN65_02065 [Gluconacetobacter azotocaptans]|uniref:hypothetical protein n=1 Tax=Gluconacetobacter azotocaptans TaxID=142834 RepID=UPI00195BF666|nr:hypothetical protein [Gluconacetobacter azotocaptans]MBM9400379.1 hypothetical protein [Gluconacetobacter azotocaptans]